MTSPKTGPTIQFHSQSAEPWRVTCVDTGEDAMTGARLWRARKYLEPDGIFCATYGDGVANIDIPALIKFHKSHGKVGTLTGAHPPGRFGELVLKGSNVVRFNEKPEFSGGYLNGGIFVFNASIFDRYLSDQENLILEREPLQQMAADGELMIRGAMATGITWTRRMNLKSSTMSGKRARPRGKSGNEIVKK